MKCYDVFIRKFPAQCLDTVRFKETEIESEKAARKLVRAEYFAKHNIKGLKRGLYYFESCTFEYCEWKGPVPEFEV